MPAVAEKVTATVSVAALTKALAVITAVSARKGLLACTSHTRIEFRPEGLRLTATDLECWARLTVQGAVDGEADLLVPTDVLNGIVRSLPKADVQLRVDGQTLKLRAGGSYTIKGLPSEEMPPWPEVVPGTTWTVPGERLRAALEFVSWCPSIEKSRPLFQGVHLDMASGHVIATNGHVMGVVPIADPVKNGPGPILAALAHNTLVKLLVDGDVTVVCDGQRLAIASGDVECIIALYLGAYPDWTRVIPTGHTFEALVDRAALAAAVDRARVYVGTELGDRILLTWADGKLVASSSHPDRGEQSEELWTEARGELRIFFTVRYLVHALKHLVGEKIRIVGSKAVTGTVWSSASDDGRYYVVMPTREI